MTDETGQFDLQRGYFLPKHFSELAFAYHLEADWYRKITLRWVKAGRINWFFSVMLLVVINGVFSIFLEEQAIAVWIAVNAVVCIIALYVIQLSGKQIVATRDIAATFSERALFLQSVWCVVEQLSDKDKKEAILTDALHQLGTNYASPFRKDGVAHDAGLGFMKHFNVAPGLKTKQAPASNA